MSEEDPSDVPVLPAATVMLVDDRPDFQVYMMERNAATVFAGGMWVFPGGRVDDTDDPASFAHISVHRDDAEASRIMGLQRGGLAYYIAAIREAFEEAGILLAMNRESHQPVDLKDPAIAERFDRHRDDVNDSNRNFIEIMEEENLILDAGQMHYVARWITPPGPPRRFDARFFVARMPRGQKGVHDDSELVHSRWLSPKAILEREASGDMVLMSPTLRMVRCLALFDSADEVVEAAKQNKPDHRARVNEQREIVLPGEPGYEAADETIENGWVRLRPA